jgi:hypothetical protein
MKGETAGVDVDREKAALEVILSTNEPRYIIHKGQCGDEIPETEPAGFTGNPCPWRWLQPVILAA